MDLLRSTNVGKLLPETLPTIVTVTKKDSMSHAFKTLVDNKILSAPVWDQHKHHYTAFVDMVDMVALSMNMFTEADLTSQTDLGNLMESAVSLRNKSVGEIADFSHRNPYLPVESRAPLLAAIQLMTKWAVHRVPVIDAEGTLITVLSQSHVVHWLKDHMYSFGDLTHKTLQELGIGHAGIISIDWNQRAVDAFQLIYSKKISAVAVVDEKGTLVGNISVSDLKHIGYDATLISRLFYPIREYMKVISLSHGNEHHHLTGPQFVQLSTTLGETVTKLIDTHTHRVYVCDENQHPIGVVSNLEVLRALCSANEVQ